MAGALILAGELMRARGEYQIAFANYERFFHPVIIQKQRAAEKFAASFVRADSFDVAYGSVLHGR